MGVNGRIATVAFWIAVAVAHAAALVLVAPAAARLGLVAGIWLVVAGVYLGIAGL